MRSSLEMQAASIHRQRASAAVFRGTARVVPVSEPASAACDPIPVPTLEPLIYETASREGVDPALVKAVVRRESAYYPCAVSPKGALGLMQLMPGTADDLGVRDPFDVRQNLTGGSRFLRLMLERYGGDVALALGAYNAGPGRVDRSGGIPAIPETRDYVRDILGSLAPK